MIQKYDRALIGKMGGYVLAAVLFLNGLNYCSAQALRDTTGTRLTEKEDKWYHPVVDSERVNLYDKHFGLTFYLQQKNVRQNFQSMKNNHHLIYQPNRGIALGLGFVYRYLALSGTFNVIQNKPNETIRTKALDFQSQLSGRRYVSFLYAQYYKGFFSDQSFVLAPGQEAYARPDMGMVFLGAATSFGLKKDFSFSANISSVQWQKRSGGTPLISLDIFLGINKADSVFVPRNIAADYYHADVLKNRIWSLGLGAGYAYTYVFDKHFFMTGIVSAKVPVNFIKRTNTLGQTGEEVSMGVNLSLWAKVGYNSDFWNLALLATNNRIPIGGTVFEPNFVSNTGYLRLMYTQRFLIGKKRRKQLKPVDKLLDIPYKIFEKILP
ncbi:hypothetical protein DBR32_02135 [Taibaiella sp. KBW10]|uniref:DUF4421 family protein n=1 Tax=Taibaiella sp. KBW10 TaxID=2153357 RepID=UPI000F5A6847|nr:DUF4421 family protein [Taibaiella sp. KBW10]RQO32426.1 hypothetical protein DBR32_02135 [Taibaiella sp. KBW10]